MSFIIDNVALILGGAIVLVGLLVGLPDLLRLSPRRTWAISSVSFQESIRRRVLWITPLAMLGIIAVTQLSHPVDEQDAIRQTTKYCLFATGVVVVIATLILACTSLPKEIDNRVIYTIVTKPATRLEIVLGKTLGFARTSAVILLIMGLFSFLYLQLSAAQLRGSVRTRLNNMTVADVSRDTLQHYANEGLLGARTYATPLSVEVMAKVPNPSEKYRWANGDSEQSVLFPYVLPPEIFEKEGAQLVITSAAATQQRELTQAEAEQLGLAGDSTTKPVKRMPPPPRISLMLLNEQLYSLVGPEELMDVTDAARLEKRANANSILLNPAGAAVVVVPAEVVQNQLKAVPAKEKNRRMFISVTGLTPATLFGFNENSVSLEAYFPGQAQPMKIRPPTEGGRAAPFFRGRITSTNGQQLRGETDPANAPVAIYEFRNATVGVDAAEIPFEFRAKIERSSSEAGDVDSVTRVEITPVNRKTGQSAAPVTLSTDSDRPTFFKLPRAAVEGGNFDLHVRSRTTGHYLSLRSNSMAMVSATNSFAWNLTKSLLILWLLSVLVVIVSIFCSTFVSWPIAVVLTLVILLGRWATTQIGEPTSAAQMATDFFGGNAKPLETKLFAGSVSALNWFLQTVSKVLPDLDQFRVTEDIERGFAIPQAHMIDALKVLGGFGLPLIVLAYLFLRKKEVAP